MLQRRLLRSLCGWRITTPCIRIRGWATAHRGNTSSLVLNRPRVRSNGGNSTARQPIGDTGFHSKRGAHPNTVPEVPSRGRRSSRSVPGGSPPRCLADDGLVFAISPAFQHRRDLQHLLSIGSVRYDLRPSADFAGLLSILGGGFTSVCGRHCPLGHWPTLQPL